MLLFGFRNKFQDGLKSKKRKFQKLNLSIFKSLLDINNFAHREKKYSKLSLKFYLILIKNSSQQCQTQRGQTTSL